MRRWPRWGNWIVTPSRCVSLRTGRPQEIALALKLTEEAAQKRVVRSLEKLRAYFMKRGVSSTTAIIAGAISTHSVQIAPAVLAKAVTAIAVTKGAAASGSTLTLIKGALKIMAWTKAKTVIITGVVVLLAAGTTTITVKEIQAHHTYPWQIPERGLRHALQNATGRQNPADEIRNQRRRIV